MSRRSFSRSLACIVFVAAGSAAGPIDPPAGPVASSMKPLDQVEPRIAITAANTPGDADSVFRISQPGSYYLVGNVEGVAGKHGIEIEASGVSLDLNGFTLAGVAGSLCGVYTSSTSEDVGIRNGRVTGWGEDGVSVVVVVGQRCGTIENVVASRNGERGIHAGTGAIVRGCTAHDNGAVGISVYTSAVVDTCSAFANGNNGISGSEGTTITACSAGGNAGLGIYVGSGGTVSGCTARWNIGSGIWISHGGTIRGCTAYQNQGDGINVYRGTHVMENSCYSNNGASSAGIRARSDGNRIENNNVAGNIYGIDVDAAGNIVIRNTARGNTSAAFSIVGGNTYGPIVTGGTGQISNTNPWANFSY